MRILVLLSCETRSIVRHACSVLQPKRADTQADGHADVALRLHGLVQVRDLVAQRVGVGVPARPGKGV